MKITKNTNLGELLQVYPQLTQVLIEEYGLYCAGCIAAAFDTVEQGAQIHGMNDSQITKMIKRLNSLIKD